MLANCMALALLSSLCCTCLSQGNEKSALTPSSDKTTPDREKAGLRGPVRSVIEERTYPGYIYSDGRVDPEATYWKKTEYDGEGRLAALWTRSSPPDHSPEESLYITRYTYTPDGRLQSRITEKDGDKQSEILYRYDDRGRIESIACSDVPDNSIAFHYDANGRKTRVSIAKPSETLGGEAGPAVSYTTGYFFGTESRAMSLPGGGSTVTLYDNFDRPNEVQIRNGAGEIVYLITREYDAHGNVLSEKQVMEDVLRMIPAVEQEKIISDAGVSAQELRDEITKVMGAGSDISSTKYKYDSHGRETLRIEKTIGHMQQRVETSYNENGDISREIWHTVTTGMPDDAMNENKNSERVFTYEYDSNQNWTAKKTASRQLPDEALKDTGELERRTIEYY